jgi:hypothetical protein
MPERPAGSRTAQHQKNQPIVPKRNAETIGFRLLMAIARSARKSANPRIVESPSFNAREYPYAELPAFDSPTL